MPTTEIAPIGASPQEIANSQARFLLLMDHSLDFLELIGRDGVIHGVSSAIGALAGYVPSDLIGRSYKDVIHPDDCAIAAGAFAEVLATGRTGPITLRYRRKDGGWRTIRASARNFLEDDTARAIIILTRDITDQMLAESSLASANAELHRLSQQLLLAQDAERAHLSRELHDELGQILVGLRLGMEGRPGAPNQGAPAPLVGAWIRMTGRALASIRDITRNLRPPDLDQLGLPASLHVLVTRMREATGRDLRITVGDALDGLPPEIGTACLRIVQEGLTNALKHAHAQHVEVSVVHANATIDISINDDGQGFDVAKARKDGLSAGRFGLLTMQERAALVGGCVDFQSSSQVGTKVHARLPVPPAEAG